MKRSEWFLLRLVGSIVFGGLFAFVLLAAAHSVENAFWKSIFLWHVEPVAALAGNGPILGYQADGTPMYEGTPVHVVFGIAGYLAGFVIYPFVIFVIWTVIGKFKFVPSD